MLVEHKKDPEEPCCAVPLSPLGLIAARPHEPFWQRAGHVCQGQPMRSLALTSRHAHVCVPNKTRLLTSSPDEGHAAPRGPRSRGHCARATTDCRSPQAARQQSMTVILQRSCLAHSTPPPRILAL